MSTGWNSPHLFVPGDTLTVDALRLILGSLEAKINGGISGADFDVSGGKFQVSSTLDLMGYDLKGAKNVPSGIANVRAFGVIGNGGVDEGGAIQAALERIRAAGIGVAFFPAGIYKSTTTIRVPSNVHIWGSGSSTEFHQESNDGRTPFFRVVGDGASRSAFYIQDCAFGHGAAVDKNVAIQIESPTFGAAIENVRLYRYAIGIQVTNGSGISIKNVFSDGCANTLTISKCSAVSVSGVYAEAIGSAYEITDVTGFTMLGLQMVGGSNDHGAIFSGCKAGVIQGLFKNAQRAGLALRGCSAVNVIGTHAIGNAYTSSGTPQRYPGILLENCSGCGVKACVSIDDNDANSYQSYGVEVNGGGSNMVMGSILTPNKGLSGTTSSDDPEFAVLDKGTGTLLIGVQKVSF